MEYKPDSRLQVSEKEYVLDIAPLSGSLGVSLSDKSIRVLSPSVSKVVYSIKDAHNYGITGLKSIAGNQLISCGADGAKLWDTRVKGGKQQSLFAHPNTKQGILSLDISPSTNRFAVGTELVGSDAGVYIWDIRNSSKPVVSYVDSHNDDVTSIRFHPDDSTALLSGSTDGLVNLYNTSITDEDEAVYQTINHGASIHSTGFLSAKRIYALSHMETFSIYEFANPDENVEEPKPKEFGDVRGPWDCEYVVSLLPGYVACGSLSKSQFKLLPLVNETVMPENALKFNGGHGEEVVRSIYYDDNSKLLYSSGEDGAVVSWKLTLDWPRQPYVTWKDWANEEESEKKESKSEKHKSKRKHKNKEGKDEKKKKDRYKPY